MSAYQSGIYGCFDDIPNCCFVACCGPCSVCTIAERVSTYQNNNKNCINALYHYFNRLVLKKPMVLNVLLQLM